MWQLSTETLSKGNRITSSAGCSANTSPQEKGHSWQQRELSSLQGALHPQEETEQGKEDKSLCCLTRPRRMHQQ